MKHLSAAHASTKLTLAKKSVADAVDDDSRPGVANVSSANSFTKTCDTDLTECNNRQVCCGKHAHVINS